MSNRAYHYREAERLLAMGTAPVQQGSKLEQLAIPAAQVHATLATASAEVEERARAVECLAAERAEMRQP